MANCLDIIIVLNDASEVEHHPVERSSCDQKFRFHILMQREALFDINSMIVSSFIQNHQRRYALGTGTQPNYYFLGKILSLLNATLFHSHQHNLLLLLDRFENYRHHQCQKISHLKREFSVSSFQKFVRI